MTSTDYKRCRICGEIKPLSRFRHRQLKTKIYWPHNCRSCDNKRNRQHPFYKQKKRWDNMVQRCHNPNNSRFNQYGARGITVCERWRSFINFHLDMGAPPSSHHTLDRLDNSKGYSPDNCRWATYSEQNTNRRKFKRKPKSTLEGGSCHG